MTVITGVEGSETERLQAVKDGGLARALGGAYLIKLGVREGCAAVFVVGADKRKTECRHYPQNRPT